MPNPDPILNKFLEAQLEAATQLESDIVCLRPMDARPSSRWLAHFKCRGLAGTTAANLREVEDVLVHLWFPAHYLRELHPEEIVTLLDPVDLWHPNVRAPFICVGGMAPGTTLIDLLHQLYDILSWQNYTTAAGLNPRAMEWALQHQHELPLERRALRRRRPAPNLNPTPS